MKPTIGITALFDEGRDSLWMLPGYMEGITKSGGVPIMLPLFCGEEDLRQAARLCDGILLAGGQDVSPKLYGETPLSCCGTVCPQRDAAETILLDEALRLDLPVLGICRGIQLLNAHLGGTLYQDLSAQILSAAGTIHRQEPPYDKPCHSVSLIPSGPLQLLYQSDKLMVDSYHHQGIKRLADGLRCMAVSQDGLVEAAWMPGKKFVWAVQWHPEFMIRSDPAQYQLFAGFVNACKKG